MNLFGDYYLAETPENDLATQVQNTKQAIENMKYELARELGITLGADTSSRLNGTVGGEMTKRLVKLGEQYISNNIGNK